MTIVPIKYTDDKDKTFCYCPICNSELKENQIKCNYCGEKISWTNAYTKDPKIVNQKHTYNTLIKMQEYSRKHPEATLLEIVEKFVKLEKKKK